MVPARAYRVGAWKLNCSVLRNKDIQEPVESLLQEAQQDIGGFEEIKKKVVKILKEFSKLRSCFHKTTFGMCSLSLERALQEKDCYTVAHYKSKLKSLVKYRLDGLQVRAWMHKQDEEDMAMLYHANKELKEGKQQNLVELKIRGQVVVKETVIKEEVKSYYEALYNGHHRTVGDQMVNTGVYFKPAWEHLPRLAPHEADAVGAPVSEEEVNEAIKDAKLGSAPGPDGLPYELYKVLCSSLVPLLTRVYNHYILEVVFPQSYRTATTRLFPKVDGVPAIDQLKWIFLSTDIFKAYDRTHVGYIARIMAAMGFSESFIDTINLILKDSITVIQVFDGVTVKIIQGLKQGDPLSVVLFILTWNHWCGVIKQ